MKRSKNQQNEVEAIVTPKLRFPEFQGESGWCVVPLKSACQMQAGKFVEASNIYGIQSGGLFPCYGGNGLRGYTASFTHSGRYPLIGRQGALCGNVKLATGDFHATEHAVVATAQGGVDIDWLYYTLGLSNLNQYATGQAQPGLSVEVLDKVPIALPPRENEQKKVAECLGTLDELIGAESQKLDALKSHKKGLMQQLFPREGETLPRFRFPEFRSASAWMTTTGGRLFANRREAGESGLPIYSVTVNDGMVPRASFDRDFYDIEDPAANKKVCKGDIAYNMMRMWQGAQGVAPEDCMVSPAYVVLRPQEDVCAEFFAYLFKLPQSLELLAATSRGLTKDRLRLYFDDFARMRLRLPSFAEQHRIATCLSSLDGLLIAQANQLDALRAHKQGLMQQLFPSPVEGQA